MPACKTGRKANEAENSIHAKAAREKEGITVTAQDKCTEEALLPCPFCGKIPTYSKHFKLDIYQLIHHCDVMGTIAIDWSDKKALIARRWNTRRSAQNENQID